MEEQTPGSGLLLHTNGRGSAGDAADWVVAGKRVRVAGRFAAPLHVTPRVRVVAPQPAGKVVLVAHQAPGDDGATVQRQPRGNLFHGASEPLTAGAYSFTAGPSTEFTLSKVEGLRTSGR